MSARIAWALVNYGPIYSPVYASHLRAIAKASRTLEVQQLGGIYGCGASDRMYTHSSENRVVMDFLNDESLTHIFMTEGDMILPDDTLPMLLDVDKPIASGVYVLRRGDGQPCLYKKFVRAAGPKPEDDYTMSPVRLFPTEQPFPLNGCPGVGCVLIAREVFAQVAFPWFDLKENGYGSDMYFFTKCRRAGVEVWVHPLVRCGHMDYYEWTFDDYLQRVQEDPGFVAQGGIVGLPDGGAHG